LAVNDLRHRVSTLEANTMSGMPKTTVAERFDSLHDRMDIVGTNVLDAVSKLRSDTIKNLVDVHQQIGHVALRLDKVYLRLDQHDGRFNDLESAMDEKFGKVDKDIAELKTDVGELKTDVGELKTDVGELKTGVGELKTGFGELKSMLISLGAKAPES
jgi:chromosome segregation ATPase